MLDETYRHRQSRMPGKIMEPANGLIPRKQWTNTAPPTELEPFKVNHKPLPHILAHKCANSC